MKKIKLFTLILSLLLSSCESKNTFEHSSTPTAQEVILTDTISTQTSLLTIQPTPTFTSVSTKEISEPEIVAILGAKIPPPWYSQKILFSPNNQLLVSSYSNKITLWQVGSYNKLYEFVVLDENYGVQRFAFSYDSRFLATTMHYYDDLKSHLFVWDLITKELVLSKILDEAILAENSNNSYVYPAVAIAFIPKSTSLVTADGNTIQIINLENDTNSITINLGQDMYATNISFPEDGRFIYVFMDWWKDNGITSFERYQTKYIVQIWDTNSHFLWNTLSFPELSWGEEFKVLHGSYLVTKTSETATYEMMSLENEEVLKLPYRKGWNYITADNKFILFLRYFGIYPYEERGLEFWTTDSWRMLYKFKPEFYDYPDNQQPQGSEPDQIAINKNNSLLAIAYAGEIFIYDIRILTSH